MQPGAHTYIYIYIFIYYNIYQANDMHVVVQLDNIFDIWFVGFRLIIKCATKHAY